MVEKDQGPWYQSKPHSFDHKEEARKALQAKQIEQLGRNVLQQERLQKRMDMDLYK